MTPQRLLFFTDIHQNIDALHKFDFTFYDYILCGGDLIAPSSPDIEMAKKIIDFLPPRTMIVPGNCDSYPEVIDAMKEKLTFLHERVIDVNGINFMGLGYSPDIRDDIKNYRKYFLEDTERITDFINKSPLQFLLKYCGINVRDDLAHEIVSEEAGQDLLKEYAALFDSITEERIAAFFEKENSRSIDILMTHSPPYGALDRLPGLPHAGSSAIARGVNKVKPRLVLCGHFHELEGDVKLGDIPVFNPGALGEFKYGEILFDHKKVELFYKKLI